MYSVFVDDAQQKKPTRPGMTSMVATGAVVVPVDAVAVLEREIEDICNSYGFSTSDEIKWSPKKKNRRHRDFTNRAECYIKMLSLAKQSDAKALVVISDTRCEPVVRGLSDHQFATFAALLERIDNLNSVSIVISDQPGGGYKDNKVFLDNCKELITKGTSFRSMNQISINVVTTSSHHVRLLQLADVVTSCTLAYISGEDKHSPPVFKHIKPIVRQHYNSYGGAGIKIHPDYLYANLYHWLLGDSHYNRGGSGHPFPIQNRPYSDNPKIC